MIIEMMVVGTAITGFMIAAGIAREADKDLQRTVERKEQQEKKARRLLGVKIGVACFEPNGSVHDLEGEVINCILQTSGRCVTTNRHLIREHLKGLDVCKHDESLVNADLLIAGTVIEQTQKQNWVNNSPSYTKDFLAWVRSHYPYNIDGTSVYDCGQYHYLSQSTVDDRLSGRKILEKDISAEYQRETKKLPVEYRESTTTTVSLRVDFRCYSPQGEVMGAGVIVREIKDAGSEPRLSNLRSLASEIVDRIHVSTSDGSVEVWYGDARAMATTRRIQEDQWKLIESRKNGEG